MIALGGLESEKPAMTSGGSNNAVNRKRNPQEAKVCRKKMNCRGKIFKGEKHQGEGGE